jgi:hypothetical protein
VKKSRKVALAALGLPIIVSGVVALDAVVRAGSVITAHENRLAADIWALRLRQQPSPLEIPKDPRFAYEEGQTGQTRVWEEIVPIIHLPMATADETLESIARCQEILLEIGFSHGPRRFASENLFLIRFRELLGEGLDGAPRLRRAATLLDLLYARRIESEDLRRGEHILDRAEVLNAYQKGDPSLGKPGWRELYFRRILAAKRLNQLEEDYRRPIDDRQELRHQERLNQAQWRLTRAAVAVMIHHRENGSLPEEMNGLKISRLVLQDVDGALEWVFPTH